MLKPLANQIVTDGGTDRPTDTARCRVACPRLKTIGFFDKKVWFFLKEKVEAKDKFGHHEMVF